ncbi:MAG: PKD domain-containing protein [Capnocytophaga sp.]|nr:PKD domain-containing protein [Capnocytophaga sp.]
MPLTIFSALVMRYPLFIIYFLMFFSCYRETEIPVEASFKVVFKNADQSVPVYLDVQNTSSGGDHYYWEFEGGEPQVSTEKSPTSVLYSKYGTYQVKLTVKNEYEEASVYTQTVEIKDAVEIGFTKEILQNDFPPVEVKFTNTTKGENLTYRWRFENGNPASFEGKNPPNIIFSKEGTHAVTLLVSNGYEEKAFSEIIEVKPPVTIDFSWQTAGEDYDYQSPVKIFLENQTKNALSYQWQFQGGTPTVSSEKNPEVTFRNTGIYTISLTASNGKTSQTLQKQITVHPNTGIYVLENVKLGINYAHNTRNIAAFYSTKLRKSFFSNEITPENASLIDIVFHGNNQTFASNRFISPTEVQKFGFQPIEGSTSTVFVNSQEICNCGLNFTESDFDMMTNDVPLEGLSIGYSAAGVQSFGKSLPRVVLFKTQDGRKGAIKIKEFVQIENNSSYVLCDIKVQK